MTDNWGTVAERDARSWIGEYGLPDFVYKQRRSGGREISDGIVAVENRGLLLEVKSREPGHMDSPEAARRWLDRRIRKATQQIENSKEMLLRASDLQFRSLRSDPDNIDSQSGYFTRQFGSDMHWQGVVLIEHDRLPVDYIVDTQEQAVVMTLDDWKGLCFRVRSAYHVIEYVRRVIESGELCALGDEYSRYGRFAAADREVMQRFGGIAMLPSANISDIEGLYLEMVLEWVHEDVAYRHTDEPLSWQSSDEYRHIAEQIDKLPLEAKVKLGNNMCRIIETASERGRAASTSHIMSGDQARFIFFADSMDNWPDVDFLTAHLLALANVRHEEFNKVLDNVHQPTLLLARLTDDMGENVRRTYCFVEGDSSGFVPDDIRDIITRHHGSFRQARRQA